MLEKWMLVFLIVGGTSLVFIICFPIDFYLYRRRKRLIRKRNNVSLFKPPPASRTGLYHAPQTSIDMTTDANAAEMEQKLASAENPYKKGNSFVRLVSLFSRKRKEEHLMKMRRLNESKSESISGLTVEPVRSVSFQKTRDSFINNPAERKLQSNKDDENYVKKGNIKVSEEIEIENRSSVNKAEPLRSVSGNLAKYKADYQAAIIMVETAPITMDENDELMDSEKKHLNYGAFQTFEDIHYNIDIRQRRDGAPGSVDVEETNAVIGRDKADTCVHYTVLDDNDTDNQTQLDLANSQLCKRNDEIESYTDGLRIKLNYPHAKTKTKRKESNNVITESDVNQGSEIDRDKMNYTSSGSHVHEFKYTDKYKQQQHAHKSASNLWYLESTDLPMKDVDTRNNEIKTQSFECDDLRINDIDTIPVHSYSEQCIALNANNTKKHNVHGRKINAITPTDNNVNLFPDNMLEQENEKCENGRRFKSTVSSHKQTDAKGKKKKRRLFSQKDSTKSLPGLPTQRFSDENQLFSEYRDTQSS